MIPALLDWRTRSRWGSLPLLIAGKPMLAHGRWQARFILLLQCSGCGQRYLAAAPAALEPCLACGGRLERLDDAWDLCTQQSPGWWEVPG